MANYPQELAQDAVCHSHTGHMTGLWFLPTRPLRLNANKWMMNVDTAAFCVFMRAASIIYRSDNSSVNGISYASLCVMDHPVDLPTILGRLYK